MSSFHYLHARKKNPHQEEEEFGLGPQQHPHEQDDELDVSAKSRRRNRGAPRSKATKTEMECAAGAVGFFLVLGLVMGYLLLHNQHRKVVLHVIRDPWGHGGAVFRRKKAGFHHHFYSGNPRFVTVIMPSVVHPERRSVRLESIYETWGPYARAVFVLHNQTEFPQGSHMTLSEETIPYDRYSYPQNILLPPHIGVNDGLPRLYYTIRTVFHKVDPDFCFFANDHTFVIPEHLCQFLADLDPEKDLYAGHALKNGKSDVFNSGAAGYVLSRATMRKLVSKWDAKDTTCWKGPEASSWLQGNPGLVTVQCLQSLGIKAYDTRAAGKWHRFHAFPLTRVVAGAVDQWYKNKHEGMDALGYDKSYTELLSGEDCCARRTISFHYVESKECRALFATRNALLYNPKMSDTHLQELMTLEWPKEFREIGGYSRGLPKASNRDGWKKLLAVVRKISRQAPDPDCFYA